MKGGNDVMDFAAPNQHGGAEPQSTGRNFGGMTPGRIVGWIVSILAGLGVLLGGSAALAGASGSGLLSGVTNLVNSVATTAATAPGTTAPTLSGALSGGVGNALAGTLCPITQALTLPGANILSAIVCALGVVDYAYKTTYTPASGPPVVRYTRALLAVPTPINVTGNGVPDFLGTITLASLPLGVELDITRLPVLPADAKVTVEAVIVDPVTAGTYLGVGEDGSTAGTASNWTASVNLVSISSSGAELGLSIKTSGAPSNLGVLGELFSGNSPDSPTNVSRGDVNFAPVPATLTSDVKFSSTRLEAAITSSVASVVSPAVTLISPTKVQDFNLTINKLPTSVDVVYDTTGGHSTFDYTGSAPIGTLDATYDSYQDATVALAAAVHATGVPTGLSFDQFGPQITFSTTGGPIASVEARYGQGTDAPPVNPAPGAYANYESFAGGTTAAVRIFNLEGLSISEPHSLPPHPLSPTISPFTGDLQLSQPLSQIQLEFNDHFDGGLLATGSITDLPAHTGLVLDLLGGAYTFNGYGSGIGEVHLDASSIGNPFFGRVFRIEATIDDIPALESFDFADSPTGLTASASAPLGNVSLLLSDGSDAPNVSGPYVDYIDTVPTYLAYVDIKGFEDVAYGGSPSSALTGSFDTTTPQDLPFGAHTSEGIFKGTIAQLPSHVDFAMTTDSAGNVTMTVNCKPSIQIFQITGSGLTLGIPATNVQATLTDLPPFMSLDVPSSTQPLEFAASAPIGEINAQVWQNGANLNYATGPADSLFFDNLPGQYIAAADILGLQDLSFDPGTATTPLKAIVATTTAVPENLTATVWGEPNLVAQITSTITDLPPTITFSMTPNSAGSEAISYLAGPTSAVIPKVVVTGSGLILPIPANNISATLTNVPTSMDLTFGGASQALAFDADAPIGQIDAQAWADGSTPDTTSGPDSLYLDDGVLGKYSLEANILGLKELNFVPGSGGTTPLDGSIETSTTSPQKLSVSVYQGNQSQDQSAAAIACPSPNQCSASLGQEQLATFDPTLPQSAPVIANVDSDLSPVTSLSCPTVHQCSGTVANLLSVTPGSSALVPGDDGSEFTVDPRSPGAISTDVFDDTGIPTSMVCPGVNSCLATDNDHEGVWMNPNNAGGPLGLPQFSGDNQVANQLGDTTFTGEACPALQQCTEVDNAGDMVTITPYSGTTRGFGIDNNTDVANIDSGEPLAGLACPGVNVCTAVDSKGNEETFDPNETWSPAPSPSTPTRTLPQIDGAYPIDSMGTPTAVACPAVNQCTAVDSKGQEITFDPPAPDANGLTFEPNPTNVTSATLDGGSALLAVACPAANQCTAVDGAGNEVTFNPQGSSSVVSTTATTADLGSASTGITTTITDLPATIDFCLTTGTGGVVADYNASSSIATMSLDADGPWFGNYANTAQVEVDGIPRHMTLSVPSGSGAVSFQTYGDHVQSVLAQVYGASSGPLAIATSGDQGILYNQETGQLTVSLQDVGPFSATEGVAPLVASYDIAAVPLEISTVVGEEGNPDIYGPEPYTEALANYLTATVSNPEPATITLTPNFQGTDGAIKLQYAASELVATPPIQEIDLTTNLGGNFVQVALKNLPQSVTVCEDSVTGGPACSFGWVPDTAAGMLTGPSDGQDPSGDTNSGGTSALAPSTLSLGLAATDIDGNPPAQQMTLSGFFCPDSDALACLDDYNGNTSLGVASESPAVLSFANLKFGSVQLGMGSWPSTSSFSGDQNWFALNTFGQPVSADSVKVWSPNHYAAGPNVVPPDFEFTTNKANVVGFSDTGPADGSLSSTQFVVVEDDPPNAGTPIPNIKTFYSGTLTCSNPVGLQIPNPVSSGAERDAVSLAFDFASDSDPFDNDIVNLVDVLEGFTPQIC